jgi:hypothetical protein
MTKWKRLRKLIPNRVQIKRKVYYDVIWTEKFPNQDLMGLTDFEKHQITLKLGMSDKATVITYLHELLHAFSSENDVVLTESQVLQLENTFYYIMKDNNLFGGLK